MTRTHKMLLSAIRNHVNERVSASVPLNRILWDTSFGVPHTSFLKTYPDNRDEAQPLFDASRIYNFDLIL